MTAGPLLLRFFTSLISELFHRVRSMCSHFQCNSTSRLRTEHWAKPFLVVGTLLFNSTSPCSLKIQYRLRRFAKIKSDRQLFVSSLLLSTILFFLMIGSFPRALSAFPIGSLSHPAQRTGLLIPSETGDKGYRPFPRTRPPRLLGDLRVPLPGALDDSEFTASGLTLA
jgi:hypothetical protein